MFLDFTVCVDAHGVQDPNSQFAFRKKINKFILLKANCSAIPQCDEDILFLRE